MVSLKQALIASGFSLNEELEAFCNDFNSDRAEMSIESQSWSLPEPPADTYPAALIENAKAFSDVAVCIVPVALEALIIKKYIKKAKEEQ